MRPIWQFVLDVRAASADSTHSEISRSQFAYQDKPLSFVFRPPAPQVGDKGVDVLKICVVFRRHFTQRVKGFGKGSLAVRREFLYAETVKFHGLDFPLRTSAHTDCFVEMLGNFPGQFRGAYVATMDVAISEKSDMSLWLVSAYSPELSIQRCFARYQGRFERRGDDCVRGQKSKARTSLAYFAEFDFGMMILTEFQQFQDRDSGISRQMRAVTLFSYISNFFKSRASLLVWCGICKVETAFRQ